jgi:hypothetical protein
MVLYERHLEPDKSVFHFLEMRRARFAQPIRHRRSIPKLGTTYLAVENPKRVGLHQRPRIVTQLVVVRAQVQPKLLDVGGTADPVTEGVEPNFQSRHSDRTQISVSELDHLHVGGGRLHIEVLDAYLPELASAPALGALVAEHRPRVGALPCAMGARVEERPHHSGSPLWPEGQRPVTAVIEGVHLLGHNLAGVTHPALEELRRLEDRSHHQGIAIPG